MTFDEAKELLLRHSFASNVENDPEMESGFLGSLRPWRGLNDDNFYEVMEAIKGVSEHLQDAAALDREVMGALWDICLIARAWGVQADGMLRRNHLISHEDSLRLEEWVDTISWVVSFLMAGNNWQRAVQAGNMRDLDLSRLK